jgi:hypothetical protein
MKFRSLTIAVLAAAMFANVTPTFADVTSFDEEWTLQPASDNEGVLTGFIGVDSRPSEQLLSFPSYYDSFEGPIGNPTSINICASSSDEKCLNFSLQNVRAELVPCSAQELSDCLQSLIVRDASGKDIPATLTTGLMAPVKTVFKGDPAIGLPSGGNPLLYSIPGASHSGGDLYLVKPDLFLMRNSSSEKFRLNKFEAVIYPVKRVLLPRPGTASTISTKVADYQGGLNVVGGGGADGCTTYTDGMYCFIPQAFPTGVTFGLDLRLSANVYGWLHGRFKNPDISIGVNPANKDGVELTIIADPIKVPVVGGFIKSATAPADILKYFSQTPYWGNVRGRGNSWSKSSPLTELTVSHEHFDPSQEVFDEVRAWLNALGDKSVAEPSYWLVQTVANGGDVLGKCTADTNALAGIVTTNATMYLPGPPTFNKTDGVLDYKVVAPHFTRDGEVFLGTYNLSINSKVARCIYGFSNAPISATVSITSSDGNSRVATTTVTERNGFLNLSAYGFEFSDPTISVKITGEKVATRAPVAQPTPIAAKSKVTISCVKGKVVRKVTAYSPQCPMGYKKK